MLDLNLYAITYIVAAVVSAAFAWIVYVQRPHRAENRRLALLYALTAATLTGVFVMYSSTSPAMTATSTALIMPFWMAATPALLLFLATFDSPLARPLANRWVERLLIATIVLLPVAWLFLRVGFVQAVVPFEPYVPYRPAYNRLWDWHNNIWAFVLTYSVLVALTAWGRAPRGTVRRRQMAMYATVTVLVDATNASRAFVLNGYINDHVVAGTAPAAWTIPLFLLLPSLATLVLVFGMAYAMMRTQIFGIDLRIRWTIEKGTIAAMFLAAFFVVSEFAANTLSDRYGTVLGLGAAGALVFALSPLQRMADRVATKAMPGVANTDEYRTVRRRELYQAAVESALEDGLISDRERHVLATLADQLDLGSVDALEIERQAKAALA